MGYCRRLDVARAAEGWIGTPFHHQARVRGVGVDCAGLVVGVARELGISVHDETQYPRTPQNGRLEAALEKNGRRIPLGEAGAGCALLFWFAQRNAGQHVAILTSAEALGSPLEFSIDFPPAGGWELIHAYAGAGCVVRGPYDDFWSKRAMGAWAIGE